MLGAFLGEVAHHAACRRWLEGAVKSDQSLGVSELVLSGFVRIVTNRAIFKSPTPLDEALLFARILREQPHGFAVAPGPRHWEIRAIRG